MFIVHYTEDGSHTLYQPDIDEAYHSTHGAVQESNHIFIQAALQQCKKREITVFEVGFGTGLNAFLSLLETKKSDKIIHYTAVERFPVPIETAEKLNYACHCGLDPLSQTFHFLHTSEWGRSVKISDNFFLTKLNINFLELTEMPKFDVCYFDAFSPEKQPEMWSKERFNLLYKAANSNAILTTYCAKGIVRRTLQEIGFTVERLAGPKGKREMLRALKNANQ